MFCLAALLPAAIVFWMTYRTAAADAEAATQRALRQGGKDFALGVYGRLEIAAGALATADADAIARDGRDPFLALYFSQTALVDLPRTAPGTPSVAPAAALGDPGAVPVRLRVESHADGVALKLVRVTGSRVLVGTLDPAFLWGGTADMRQDMRICMYAGRERLFCGGHPGTERGDRLLAETWDLFLRARFAAEPWTVAAVAGAGHGLRHYSGVIAPAAAAVLLLAMLLSSIQIRRVLVPLSDLLRRIRAFDGASTRIARQAGEDEFDLLSRTFDGMQHRIGRQMDTLRALSDVDRLILEGASLLELVDLVARRIQEAVGPTTVCVLVSAVDADGDATLFLRRRGGNATEQIPCPGACGAVPTAAQGRWQRVDELGGGALRDACLLDGVREVLVLAPAEHPGRVQVVLGFEAQPRELEGPFAQAQKLAEAIPVAVAFEERRQRLEFQAHHDPLTQLPNRLATFEAVATAIEAAERSGSRFAVAFLDLDRFKSINDGLGHASGDELLVGVGRRIRASLPAHDFVGRFGGDEFCIILADAGGAAEAESAMQRVVDGLARPVEAGGRQFVQRFSAGIAFYPVHGRDASTLIRNADVAMYHGKRAGGRALRMFEPEMNAAAQSSLQMENDLREAIAAGAIDVHYQPRVDSRNGRILGVEALARWTHPQRGPIPPSTFVVLAEAAGLIDDLGALVLRKACRQKAAWKASGLSLPVVAVNVSSHQLRSRRLVETLRTAIDSAGIDPPELEIEITETMLVQDSEAGEQQLRSVHDMGVAIAIDDFGTGYSSLSYLAGLPVDTLKIDRAFVLGIGDGNTEMAAIIRAIIGLAKELGKNVIAEGVESMVDVELLADWGCYTIQGYAYYKARDAKALAGLLRAQPQAG
ncbi:putative bifunctional diguanylate cyclase/phosphodiesterase [Luteimonas saliphila]|uniref:putative bifunctional diguanylate cyclase/phosphodiesterase n=1 Tax=Luteimonas saliphila TaxID=2804919 RepID=UPI00192DFDF2|nr:EAL domain-containing protein [Luteimonas saliphila]